MTNSDPFLALGAVTLPLSALSRDAASDANHSLTAYGAQAGVGDVHLVQRLGDPDSLAPHDGDDSASSEGGRVLKSIDPFDLPPRRRQRNFTMIDRSRKGGGRDRLLSQGVGETVEQMELRKRHSNLDAQILRRYGRDGAQMLDILDQCKVALIKHKDIFDRAKKNETVHESEILAAIQSTSQLMDVVRKAPWPDYSQGQDSSGSGSAGPVKRKRK